MEEKTHPGYPQYVIVSMMKSGTKSMNKCFKSLGYRGKSLAFIRKFQPTSMLMTDA